jgi:hypothetical protein
MSELIQVEKLQLFLVARSEVGIALVQFLGVQFVAEKSWMDGHFIWL